MLIVNNNAAAVNAAYAALKALQDSTPPPTNSELDAAYAAFDNACKAADPASAWRIDQLAARRTEYRSSVNRR